MTVCISRLEGMEAHAKTADIRLAKWVPCENFYLLATDEVQVARRLIISKNRTLYVYKIIVGSHRPEFKDYLLGGTNRASCAVFGSRFTMR